MRSEEEVKNKAIELYERYQSKFVERYLTRDSITCKYNIKHRIRENGKVGFCNCLSKLQDEHSPIFVCQDKETAENCVFYQCADDERSIIDRFEKDVNDPSVCGQKYPKLAVLIWVLQQSDCSFPEETTHQEAETPESTPEEPEDSESHFGKTLLKLWGFVSFIVSLRWLHDR